MPPAMEAANRRIELIYTSAISYRFVRPDGTHLSFREMTARAAQISLRRSNHVLISCVRHI